MLEVRAPAPYTNAAYQGVWQDNGSFRYCRDPGARATVEFEGVGIHWLGACFDDAGQAEVQVDGAKVAVVDQYGPGRNLPFDWKSPTMSPGRHVLTLTVLEGRAAASLDRYINVAGFEVVISQAP